jgi:hypothetical protein
VRAILLAAACCLACASYPREGRACGVPERGYDRALEHALALAPGATALADVSWSFERLCVVVRGTAVRIAPATAPGP